MCRRITGFLLAICLLLGSYMLPVSAINVYGEEIYDGTTSKDSAFTMGSDVDQVVSQPLNNIEFPNHLPRVNMQSPATRASATEGEQRYTVLVLDTSASSNFVDKKGNVFYTADTAVNEVKTAAKKFIEGVQSANGTNYVAIVEYRGAIWTTLSGFSTNVKSLSEAIDGIYAYQGTRSVASGLANANILLNKITDPNAIKNVVLFTTGMTNDGSYSYEGHYDETTVASGWHRADNKVKLYAYANSAHTVAEKIKKQATLYTIGLFQTMENMPEDGRDIVQFFKLSALEWATSPRYFYDVKDPNDLDFIFGEVADSIVKKTGSFKYAGSGSDNFSTYYYDDAYFYEDSYIYNQHLATMSLCLELSSWGSEDVGNNYSLKMVNAENLFLDIGFKDFDHNYMDFNNNGIEGKPTKDSIGAVAANKSIAVDGVDYTLIALAVRGGGYESEWAGNFTVGEIGDHQGFSGARDQVLKFLNDYVRENGITGKIKLWITGYSRGGATANMVAGAIDEGKVSFPGCSFELKDMYAYTFEAPAGVWKKNTKRSIYNNIFNVINLSDPVPMVAPLEWSFSRYGIDRRLPNMETHEDYEDSQLKMLECYERLEGTSPYEVDGFLMKRLKFDGWTMLPGGDPPITIVDDEDNITTQYTFLNQYITMLSKDFLKNRSNYVTAYQDGIRDILGLLFGSSKSQSEELIEVATEKFNDHWGRILFELLKPSFKPSENERDAYEKVAQYLQESLDEVGITEYTPEEFEQAVVSLMDLVVEVAVNHPNLATTLVQNMGGIGQAHFPEVCLAWMQSMDSYYTQGGAEDFTSGKYRVVRINCPVDVEIYNSEHELVAAIVDDTPQRVSSLIATINEDGEKLVYLPASAGYYGKITATGDGMMSYAVNEFNPEAGEINRMVNHYDIPIVEGQEFLSEIPAYQSSDLADPTKDVSSTLYTLETNGRMITPDQELSGEAATSAYFSVMASANDKSYGIVMGTGTRQLGTFAQLEAIPYPGCEFIGWFGDENLLVSNEAIYRFRVKEDTTLTAKFLNKGQEGTRLSALEISGTVISPEFEPDTFLYTATVPYDTDQVTVTATASNASAVIAGTGTKDLDVGDNEVTVTVTAEGVAVAQDYIVQIIRAEYAAEERRPERIQIKTKPYKTRYKRGEEWNPAGLLIEAYGASGVSIATISNAELDKVSERKLSSWTLSESEYTLDLGDFDTDIPGEYEITVICVTENQNTGEETILTDSFFVEVLDETFEDKYYITGIEVKKRPNKTLYRTGEELDSTGLVIIAKCRGIEHGERFDDLVLNEDDYELHYDFETSGRKKVTALYDGINKEDRIKTFHTSFYVQVKKNGTSYQSDSDSNVSSVISPGWKQSGDGGWKYVKPDGTYAAGEWMQISYQGINHWYYFTEDGDMETGWISDPQDGHRYYLNPETGTLVMGTVMIDGIWYHFNEISSGESGWTYNRQKKRWIYEAKSNLPLGAMAEKK